MNFKKSYVVECLTRGYIKTPVSLKKQALDSLALRICDKWSYRQHLVCIEWSSPYVHSAQIQRAQLLERISRQSEELCKALSLPHTLQECLLDNIQRIIMHLFKWIGMWKYVFNISSSLTADFWMPSDWIHGRLNERKIAEHIIQDKSISNYECFRLSCTYCLEEFIPFFWDLLSEQERHFLASSEEHGFPYSKVIVTWSRYMKGYFENQQIFLARLFFYGLCLSPLNNVPAVFSWNKLNRRLRRALLKNIVVDKESDSSDDEDNGDGDNHEDNHDDNDEDNHHDNDEDNQDDHDEDNHDDRDDGDVSGEDDIADNGDGNASDNNHDAAVEEQENDAGNGNDANEDLGLFRCYQECINSDLQASKP